MNIIVKNEKFTLKKEELNKYPESMITILSKYEKELTYNDKNIITMECIINLYKGKFKFREGFDIIDILKELDYFLLTETENELYDGLINMIKEQENKIIKNKKINRKKLSDAYNVIR